MSKALEIKMTMNESSAVIESTLREIVSRGIVSEDVVSMISLRKYFAARMALGLDFLEQNERTSVLLLLKRNVIKNGKVDRNELLEECRAIKTDLTDHQFEMILNDLVPIYDSTEESIRTALDCDSLGEEQR
jgi:hypothetical protein